MTLQELIDKLEEIANNLVDPNQVTAVIVSDGEYDGNIDDVVFSEEEEVVRIVSE